MTRTRRHVVEKLQRDSASAVAEFSPDGQELYGRTYLRMVGAAVRAAAPVREGVAR